MSAADWVSGGIGTAGVVVGILAWLRAGRATKAAERSATAAERSAEAAEESVSVAQAGVDARGREYRAARQAQFLIVHVLGHGDRGGGWGIECTFKNFGGGPADKVRLLFLEQDRTRYPQSGGVEAVPPSGEFERMLYLPGGPQVLRAFKVGLEVTDEFGTREALVPWAPSTG